MRDRVSLIAMYYSHKETGQDGIVDMREKEE